MRKVQDQEVYIQLLQEHDMDSVEVIEDELWAHPAHESWSAESKAELRQVLADMIKAGKPADYIALIELYRDYSSKYHYPLDLR